MSSGRKDLTISRVDRQNILNNPYAIQEIETAVGLKGILFEGKHVVLKEKVAQFFAVTSRTIDNYISKNEGELAESGYAVLTGKRLKSFKESFLSEGGNETDFVTIKASSQLGVFDIRAFLNIAMLLAESEPARLLRKTMLDIVIDTINQRTGGGTKYINQRDEEFIHSWFAEENYRKQFTDALRDYVAMGNFKYPNYTNKIYVSIFKENADEYRKVLNLQKGDITRDTFYAEILDLVSSFECGFAEELKAAFEKTNRKLTSWEVDELFSGFEKKAHWKPLIDKARNKMASRDLAFRDALHLQLKEYISPIQKSDFESFIGEKSKDLQDRLEDAKDVMKRLKERE